MPTGRTPLLGRSPVRALKWGPAPARAFSRWTLLSQLAPLSLDLAPAHTFSGTGRLLARRFLDFRRVLRSFVSRCLSWRCLDIAVAAALLFTALCQTGGGNEPPCRFACAPLD